MNGLANPRWRKSSYSNANGGACVEVAVAPDGGRYLRDSKNPGQPPRHLTAEGWRAFRAALTNH